MVRKEEFNFPSADKETEIHSIRWIPDGEIKAILQISHGMVEHINRYDAFASYLAEQGILVTGNDHLGHGRSVKDEGDLAHFPKGGNKVLLKDIHYLRCLTEKKYPGIPYFVMGHSMGSFLIRQYICMQSDGLAGAVVMGTGNNDKATLNFGRSLAGIKARIQGDKHHSKMLTALVMGSYNSHIKNRRTSTDWLSRDDEHVDRYNDDPLCGLNFTNQAYREMFTGMIYLKNPANLAKMRKDLPVLLISGAEDPVGNYGKGVRQVEAEMNEMGMRDLSCIIYEGARHEILNETNNDEVFKDLADWITEHISESGPEEM